jgi:hypothetical protein
MENRKQIDLKRFKEEIDRASSLSLNEEEMMLFINRNRMEVIESLRNLFFDGQERTENINNLK